MKIKLIYLSTFLILMSACSKDWLEIEPVARYTTDEYKPDNTLTAENAQATLDGAYIPYGYLNPWGTSIWVSLNCLTDEVNVGGGAAGDRPEFEALNNFTVNASSNAPDVLFDKLYRCVNAVNILMRDSKDNPDPALVPILAEAKVLRAFYYFDLIRMFGGVPYVLGEDLQSVYDRTDPQVIIDDLILTVKDNVGNLVDKSADGKFNKAAAYTLLGKMNMWKGDYQEAAKALDKVVSNPKFGLMDDYESVFNYADQFNKEVIYTITWDGTLGYSWTNWVKTSNVDLRLCGIRSLSWKGDAELNMVDGWGFLKPRQGIVNAYIAENDAVRLNANVWIADSTKDNDLFTFKFYQNASWSDTYGYEGYFRKKYNYWDAIPHVTADACGMNEIIYRYSDVLLLMAECAVNGATTPLSASDYINLVRDRVSLPAKSGVTMADVKLERRLELAFEFDRFFDLVRWGDAASVLAPFGYRPITNGLLPIPLTQIIASGKALTQNEGY